MQVLSIPVTTNILLPQKQVAPDEKPALTKLDRYLASISWNTRTLTNKELEIILVAACLRFLGGLTDLDFVLGLAQEIKKKYKEKMKLSLWYSMEALDVLMDKLRGKIILPTDTEVIHLVNDAQEFLTKRRVTLSDE